ncbi:ABC transporter-like protein [Penicillium herquei]|nr:ABC transporter-like protein [Penicillium herquei]
MGKTHEPDIGPNASPIYRSKGRALGILYEDVNVLGIEAGTNGISTLPAIVWNIIQWPIQVVGQIPGKRTAPSRFIIRNANGVLYPGESMLVLGRPGAGPSTLLKVLANNRESFQDVQGRVQYAGISSEDMARWFRSETVYSSEEDTHFATLPVKDTLDFAHRLRKPASSSKSDTEFANEQTGASLRSVGLSHTANTIVGDSFTRGVSGGERKRVTLVEALSVNPTMASWDNPSRGLDSSSATEFVQLITTISKDTGMTNVVSMYQVSETIYQQFDRVTVLYDGFTIFCGKASQAKDYFIRLGFECRNRQTTADFLTAITSPVERLIRKECTGLVPTDPQGLAQVFQESPEFRQLQDDIQK